MWALAYTIAYPAWPMLKSATTGVLGYSSRDAVKQELATAEAAQGPICRGDRSKDVEAILADDKLARVRRSRPEPPPSRSTACSATVRARRVRPGFPNLNDDDWLWGGSAEQIYQTISHGIRFDADGDTRTSEMPAFGDILEPHTDRGSQRLCRKPHRTGRERRA